MASRNKIIEMIAAMKTIYPYYAKDSDVELLVRLWDTLLKEYTDVEVEQGFYLALQTSKMAFAPAEVIEKINIARDKDSLSDEALWSKYYEALREVLYYSARFNYTYIDATGISQGDQARRRVDEIWADLPDEIKLYLVDKNELIRSARELNNKEIHWEKTNFMKTIPIVKERKKFRTMIAANYKSIEAKNF